MQLVVPHLQSNQFYVVCLQSTPPVSVDFRHHPYAAPPQRVFLPAVSASQSAAEAQAMAAAWSRPYLYGLSAPGSVLSVLPPAEPGLGSNVFNVYFLHQDQLNRQLMMRHQLEGFPYFQPPLMHQQPAVPPQPVGRRVEQLPAGAVWQQQRRLSSPPPAEHHGQRDAPPAGPDPALPEPPQQPPAPGQRSPGNAAQPDINHNFNIVDAELFHHRGQQRCNTCMNLPDSCSCDAPLDLRASRANSRDRS